MNIKIQLLDNGMIPKRKTNGSVGYDLFAAHDEIIDSQKAKVVALGFCIELPFGVEAQIRSRSGIALKNNVFVLNSPGTIDFDYRQEVGVILMNLGNQEFIVKKGERIAQMVFSSVCLPLLIEVDELSIMDERQGGWGSTGV